MTDSIAPDPSAHDASQSTATLEAHLRAQLDADPVHHASAMTLAGLLLHDSRVDEAIALLTAHAGDRDCGDLLREYFIGERMNDEAQRLLAQRGSHASASGLVDKAIASHLRGDIEGALSYCQLAITTDPNYAPAHNHQGRALFNARRAVPARAALVHAVRIAPNYAEAWHNLAHALRDANELEQAGRAYGHALRLRPAYRSALLNLGIVQMALRHPDAARESFDSLLAIDPTHAEGCFNLAVCEHLSGHFDNARQWYERANAIDPRNPRLPLQYGRLCSESGDSKGALRQFRRALDLNPRDAEAWSEIAMVHDQADHLDEAEHAIAAGLAVAPGDAGLRLEQANLARRRGDYDAALAGLRAIDPHTLHPRLRPRYEKSLELTLARLD